MAPFFTGITRGVGGAGFGGRGFSIPRYNEVIFTTPQTTTWIAPADAAWA